MTAMMVAHTQATDQPDWETEDGETDAATCETTCSVSNLQRFQHR